MAKTIVAEKKWKLSKQSNSNTKYRDSYSQCKQSADLIDIKHT